MDVRHARAIDVPAPYEVLLHAAMQGDSTRFKRQDGVEEAWRVMQPLVDAPPPVHPYAKGSWGPAGGGPPPRRPRPLARTLDVLMSDYDVIIIGSGAGGGTLARHLAPSGMRVLLLERGDWLPREPQNWQAHDVFVDNRYISPDTLVRRATTSRSSRRSTTASAARRSSTAPRCTGCARRTSASCATTTASRPRGRSPTRRWSRTTRSPSSATRCTARAARTRPSRPPSAPYPYPAVSHEPRIQQLADDLEAAGLRPFHAPCGVRLAEADMPHSHCVRCATCDGFPCLVHAKSDAEVLGVRPALEHANVTLMTERRGGPSRDEPGRPRRHAAWWWTTPASARRSPATSSSSSCGAANSARLLLASASDAHPDGLANGSGQVGRNYMFHNSQAVLALSKDPNPTVFQKTLGLNDFYFGAPDFDFPLGNIQMVGKSSADMYRGEKPLQTRLAPQRTLDEVARHAVDFWLSTEDLPRPENRVTLREDGSIRLSYTPSNEEPKKRLLHQLKSMLGPPRHASRPPAPAPRVPQERDPGGGLRAPGRHLPLRRPIPRPRC